MRLGVRGVLSLLAALLPLAPLLALPAPLAASAPSAAAPPATEVSSETYYDSIDVDVVNVEVVATDRAGRPVAGLTRGDFELYEDGRPVAVTNFLSSVEDALAAGRPVGDPDGAIGPATRSADQALSFAVFVDNENLTATARRPVLAALDAFLRHHAAAGDRVILARYDGGLRVSQPAPNPTAIGAAMAEMMTDTTHGGLAVEDQKRIQQARAGLEEGGDRQGAIVAGELAENAQMGGDLDLQSGRRGLGALTEFVGSLAGLPGRKALVVVTGAFAADADPLVLRLADHANTNRVTVYVLGAVEPPVAGAFRSPTPIGDNPFAAADALTGALHAVADHTGGQTAANLADPLSFLEQVRTEVDTYYSLGFTPGHPRDGKVHRLAVRLRGRNDLALRYRATYEDRSGDQRVTSETLSTLVLGGGENPLGVRLSLEEPATSGAAGGRAAADGAKSLPIVVHVPLDRLVLLPQERFHEGKLTLLVATRDERGHIARLTQLAAPVRVGNDKLLAAVGKSVDYRLEVPLLPGAQTVAVGVRDELGHLDSTTSIPVGPHAGGTGEGGGELH